MITVQKMRLYGLGIAFACFAWVGATAQTPYGWRDRSEAVLIRKRVC